MLRLLSLWSNTRNYEYVNLAIDCEVVRATHIKGAARRTDRMHIHARYTTLK